MKKLLILLAVILGSNSAYAANYTATQGAGTTFGALLVGGVNYPQFVMCDPTTPAQCVAVNASGQVTVLGTGTFVTQVNGFTSWAGGTLGAMQNFGTTPTGVLVPGMNASLFIGTAAPSATNPIWTAGAQAASTTMQNAAVANGNGSTLSVAGYQTALVNVNCSVACSGGTTVNFEGTDSTGTFFSVTGFPVAGGAPVSSAATTGQFWVPVSGLTTIRARISAYSAGTITVTGTPMYGVSFPNTVNVVGTVTANAGSGTFSINQAQVSGSSVATAATGIAKVGVTDGSGNAITSTTNALDVNVKSSGLSNQTVNYVQKAGTNVVADPCETNTKSYFDISITTNTQIIAGTSAKKTYICSIALTAPNTNVALVEGTGSVCATGIHGVGGGTTAATGLFQFANATIPGVGLVMGNGAMTILQAGNAAADNVCLLVSAANQVSGQIQYVQQ